MNGYLILRTDQGGGWLAFNIGTRGASYTKVLQFAQVFRTREEAEKQRCPGNEVVVTLESQFT